MARQYESHYFIEIYCQMTYESAGKSKYDLAFTESDVSVWVDTFEDLFKPGVIDIDQVVNI